MTATETREHRAALWQTACPMCAVGAEWDARRTLILNVLNPLKPRMRAKELKIARKIGESARVRRKLDQLVAMDLGDNLPEARAVELLALKEQVAHLKAEIRQMRDRLAATQLARKHAAALEWWKITAAALRELMQAHPQCRACGILLGRAHTERAGEYCQTHTAADLARTWETNAV